MKKLVQISTLISYLLVSSFCISPVEAKNPKLKKLYCEDNETYFQSNEIIVKFAAKRVNFDNEESALNYITEKLKQKISLRHIASIDTQQAKAQRLKRNLGINRSYIVKLEDLSADPDLISCHQLITTVKQLKRDSNISSVSPSYLFKTNSLTNDPLVTSSGQYWTFNKDELYGHKRINAPQAWGHAAGKGIVVAVVDTGVDYNHPDLWKNIWVNPKLATDVNQDGLIDLDDIDLNQNHRIDPEELRPGLIGKNFADNNNDPYDAGNGHGTHISGTIAATGNNNIGMAGVAYQAQIMPLKAMNEDGYAPFSKLAEAIIYATDAGADVINNSWNCDCETPEIIRDAFAYAHNLDVVSVMSAGNYKKELLANTPAGLNTNIAVGSTEFFDYRSYFSNYGDVVDIAAPGTSILSTLSQAAQETSIGGVRLGMDNDFDYWYLSGTSMSSAMISGAVAVIKSANPDLNNEEIRRILKTHASNLETFDQKLGAGLIDLEASVLEAISLKSTKTEVPTSPVTPEKEPELPTEQPIKILNPQEASAEIIISPANPQVGELVKIEYKGTAEQYYWNIDSDSHIESRAQAFFAKYPSPGEETIQLELIDANGKSTILSKKISITENSSANSNEASFIIKSSNNTYLKLRRDEILATKFFVEKTHNSLGRNLLLKVEVDSEYADLISMNSQNTKFIANNKNNFNIRLKLQSRRSFKTKLQETISSSSRISIPVKITDLNSNYSVTQNLVVYL